MTKKEIIELFRECFKEAREAIGANATSESTERIALHLFDAVLASEVYREVSEGMSERMFRVVVNLLDETKRLVGVIEEMSERLKKLEEDKK